MVGENKNRKTDGGWNRYPGLSVGILSGIAVVSLVVIYASQYYSTNNILQTTPPAKSPDSSPAEPQAPVSPGGEIASLDSRSERPVANAGSDQLARENTVVTLDGSKSRDLTREDLIFKWTQVAGPTKVTPNDSSAPVTTIKLPLVQVNNSMFVFRLTVKDSSGLNSSDLVRVNVQR